MFKKYHSIDSEFYQQNKDTVFGENLRLLETVVTTQIFLFAFFAAAAFLMDGPCGIFYAYATVFLGGVLLWTVVKWIKKSKMTAWVLPLFYLFYTFLFAFSLYLAVFSGESRSVTVFCVMLVLLPEFIIDHRWRITLYLMIVTVLYLFCCYFYAGLDFLMEGAAYVLACLVIGIMVFYFHMQSHIRNMEYRLHLERKVETDSLTQLYNRSAMEHHVSEYISTSEETAAFILVDVDNFKGINDHFGHMIGDDLLYQTAMVFKSQFRRTDYIGRLGGDEFVIFLPKVHEKEWLENRMQDLVEEMEKTFIGDEAVCTVSGSIGIALYPRHGRTFEELYKKADEAMYSSKKNGKNRFTFYHEEEESEWSKQ